MPGRQLGDKTAGEREGLGTRPCQADDGGVPQVDQRGHVSNNGVLADGRAAAHDA